MFEFHISRAARDRYGVTEVLFSFDGNAVFANPAASRALAHRMNQVRGTENDPAQQVQPAALFAMGLIDEAAHAVFEHYRRTVNPAVLTLALEHFAEQVGAEELERLLLAFVTQFPGVDVFSGELTPQQWLAGTTDGLPHREAAFEEMMLLWFENRNPAFAPFRELFDDTPLAATTVYPVVTAGLPAFFATQAEFGEGGGNLFSLLLPVMSGEGTLSDQLARLRARWGFALEPILRRLLLAGDVLKEEEVALWLQFNPPSAETLARRSRFGGLNEAHGEVPTFTTTPEEYEHFSPDLEWMPRTVMIAKSTYVWLHQLSRFYGREVRTLDQIPDEELQSLAARGMNALWLIGVWERSRASQTIKRLCGNADAVASAYSLYDYSIAENLGGDHAYRDLRDRCARFGIRLASDMVPNHMGIDSTWVVDHPEWFLSRHDSPYPAYSFNGPDLSGDDRVEIKIEDHYYQQTDAAVVFRRRDKWSGDTQYVYHGNDGTSFPWNDTAQLNYLSAQVREQVIQTILQVARQFPIIRFDAAMTLAKRHIQRLWFPAPGATGSIPSRAESSMTTEEFDRAIPEEFWREVVDSVAREVPGTLLLAEAFWLMEGYFVRTLGMHRVYNSAFMVMLRDEDNANYRKVLKNTLEFDPDIMKRYVNFMSNPDERTAIDQFGSGDKFFGVATLMATLPGLPMFGHGQVEGFTEKYGMEYYRPLFEEWNNDALVERHNREIAPLLHNRQLFAESSNFLLYDLWNDHGGVEENVFAFSNQRDGARALIVYNNSYSGAHGTLHQSAAYMDKGAGQLRQRSLTDALGLAVEGGVIFAWRDSATGLSHLRRSTEIAERGLRVDLRGYQYMTLLDWRELRSDATHDWHRLCDVLHGRGVEDLEKSLLALELEHLHSALRAALEPRLVRELATLAAATPATVSDDPALLPHSELLETWIERAGTFVELARAEYFKRIQPPPSDEADAGTALGASTSSTASTSTEVGAPRLAPETWEPQKPAGPQPADSAPRSDTQTLAEAEACNESALTQTRLRERVQSLLRMPLVEAGFATPWPREARTLLPSSHPVSNAGWVWSPVLAYTLLATLGESLDLAAPATPALTAFDQFALRTVLADCFAAVEFTGEDTWRAAARVRIALDAGIQPSEPEPSGRHSEAVAAAAAHTQYGLPVTAWADGDTRWLTGVNLHEGTTYFNKEAFTEILWWRALPDLLQLAAQPVLDPKELEAIATELARASDGAAEGGYQLHLAGPAAHGEPIAVPPTEPDTAPPANALTDAPAAGATGDHIAEPAARVDAILASSVQQHRAEAVPIPLDSAVPAQSSVRDNPLVHGAPEPAIAAKLDALQADGTAPKPKPAPSSPKKSSPKKPRKS
ncbi:alpha-amylase family glycosyl hydrolase [Acidipila sp. EB88]|uniref:alpha-amylase family glycosyl hydrolase n=1 Tax=Acidipila sp. EB88 TaxID=2305226 RepID=UPI000F5E5487|nr:alpha-amylase family glycosyl hydrolase [Acidipila sp. EB88]RRA47798.1 alpha-amylase [Acidipila sp. EB88]